MAVPSHLSGVWRDAEQLQAHGDLAGARDMYQAAADVAVVTYGPDQPDVIETLRRLAAVHRDLGDPQQARRVLEEAMAGARSSRPESDPIVLALSASLAPLAVDLGNRHEARRHYARLARLGPAVLGPNHPDVRAAQAYLEPPGTRIDPVPPPWQQLAGRWPGEPSGPGELGDAPGQTRDPFDRPDGGQVDESDSHGVPERTLGAVGRGLPTPATDRPRGGLSADPPGVTSLRPTQSAPPARWSEFTPPGHHLDEEIDDPPRSRMPLLLFLTACVILAVAVALVTAYVLTRPARSTSVAAGPVSAAPPSTGGPRLLPPQRLALRDDGTMVSLTWMDPSTGTVPFLVTGAIAGAGLNPLAALAPGTTSFRINGLNPKQNCCFAVVATYTTDDFAPSGLICTSRAGVSAAPATRASARGGPATPP